MLLLGVLGCAEPIPTNQSVEAIRQPRSEPRVSAQVNQGNREAESGCRTTQYWSPSLDPQNTVQVRGGINGDGSKKQYLIDVISVEKNASVFGVECFTSSELSFALPTDLGTVWLFAFVDANGNGLSKDDIQGRSEDIVVTDVDLAGVVVSVQQQMVQEAFSLSPKSGTGEPKQGEQNPDGRPPDAEAPRSP